MSTSGPVLVLARGSRVGSGRANLIQSCHMAAAFRAVAGDATIALQVEASASDDVLEALDLEDHLLPLPATSTWAGRLRHVAALHRAARSTRYRTVFSRDPSALLLARRDSRTIYEIHHPPSSRLHAAAEDRLLHNRPPDAVAVVSPALRDHYLAQYRGTGIAESVVCAPNGASSPPVAHSSGEQSLESLLQVPHLPRPVVGYFGSVGAGRTETLMKAAERLAHHTFLVVGGDSDQQRELGPAPPNVVARPRVAYRAARLAMTYCDVLVAPYESSVQLASSHVNPVPWMSPIKVFEYMSSGVPLVTTRLPAVAHVLRHGENCLLAEPGDPSSLATAVSTLAADGKLARSLADQATEDFRANHSWEARASSLLSSAQ